ncbi:hypothetical protein LOC50_16050 [Pseudoalteromonas sp. SCSIO 43095]|uniref:hypothetical protein n=1 Tax=unclassified Pseudoalteromonas TaxID=194690 RepID=UPI000976FE7F|nr:MULTISPECIES: hypothetical protein [unclassified Pseudoalteromonas]MDN3488385.1 hypothetical protein [Pseudoalteromonas sp. APC 3694]URR00183.1 hypothetical protein LOC50_16050 [Pseudoalteromonas sp. SCSIO 43095]
MSSRKIITNAFNLSALSLNFLSLNVHASIDCSALEQWQTGQTHVAGDQVQVQAYEASWWTQANPVENAGDYKDWKILGAFDNAVIKMKFP